MTNVGPYRPRIALLNRIRCWRCWCLGYSMGGLAVNSIEELEALLDQLDDGLEVLEDIEQAEDREYGKVARRNGAVYHVYHARMAVSDLLSHLTYANFSEVFPQRKSDNHQPLLMFLKGEYVRVCAKCESDWPCPVEVSRS